MTTRREAMAGAAALAAMMAVPAQAKEAGMYGAMGKMTAKPGQRDALAALILSGIDDMPGCHAYIVANDPGNPDALWIIEAWDDKAAHDASLKLPAVRAAIGKAMPLIAGFEANVVIEPVGGLGFPKG